MKSHFDTSGILQSIHEHFGKTVTPSEVRKNFCEKRGFSQKVCDVLLGDTDDFDIVRVKPGSRPYVIFVNGFLTADETENGHWRSQLEKVWPENGWFHLRWNAKQLLELGTYMAGVAGKLSLSLLARQALKEVIVPAAVPALVAYDVATNPWHQALYRAEQTGEMLAEYLCQNREKSCILLGHSLGARVIFYALRALAAQSQNSPVSEARLMGGAVGVKPLEDWQLCAKATEKGIFNYYSENDMILKGLYKSASLFTSDPIGIRSLSCKGIWDRNCSALVNGHSEYVPNLYKLCQLNPFTIGGV